MHELSIVQSIIEIAQEAATRHGIEKINTVEVEIGQSAGVVKEALDFAWEVAVKGTRLEGAVLHINTIPLQIRCRSCQRNFRPAELFSACPECGDVNPEIISGKELRVVAIETN